MKLNGDEVDDVEWFKYLGFILQKFSGFEKNMKQDKICDGWMKLREASLQVMSLLTTKLVKGMYVKIIRGNGKHKWCGDVIERNMGHGYE